MIKYVSFELEICICAAIRLPDGRVFRGQRHHDCIFAAKGFLDYQWRMGIEAEPWSGEMGRDQGFITSRNRYVDRAEGMRIQLAAGVESVAPGGYRGDVLFSEDLY